MSDKRDLAILALPDNPHTVINWVVYNGDMIPFVEERIIKLRGKLYFEENVMVISPTTTFETNGRVRFDPYFHELLGCGNH